jgi:hypothetical protein
LGADVPEAAERAILDGDEGGAAERSVAQAIDVWESVSQRIRSAGIDVPLGVNVEQISVRYLTHAQTMARAFAARLGD